MSDFTDMLGANVHPLTWDITLRVERGLPGDGWDIQIKHGPDKPYARVMATDLDTALRMVLPYIASVCEPDPFLAALTRGTP